MLFSPSIQKAKDVLQVAVSDFHSGSNFALFLGREWHGKKTSHIPRSLQLKIRGHFETFAASVKELRKGKQVKLIHNGDAIDGDHHNSGDVCTRSDLEQANIHIELMQEFQKRIGWQAGDELYYTEGTQTHVNDKEDHIAIETNAVPDGDSPVHDVLRLETNGRLSLFVHHGPTRGKGANEGNPLRAWLKSIYFDYSKESRRIPDILYTGHVHDPTWACFEYRRGFEFKQMHGVILPSWQGKTAYARQKVSVAINRVGGVVHEIKADGTVTVPRFFVMETD